MNITFDELLDTTEQLEISERQMFIDIVQHRINEQRRNEIVKDVKKGRLDYGNGNVKRGTSKDLMKEIMG